MKRVASHGFLFSPGFHKMTTVTFYAFCSINECFVASRFEFFFVLE